MTPQLVVTVATNVLPAAVFLSGNLPVRLSLGTFGAVTHPATTFLAGPLGGTLAAAVLWPGDGVAVLAPVSFFVPRLRATSPPRTTTMASTTPRTCLFRRASTSRIP